MSGLPHGLLRLPLAHRGYHDRAAGRPENSRDAFRAAIAAGYGIELDLQRSFDDRAMVFHDAALDRLTGETGPVCARTSAELAAIRLTDAADGIPTLAEVLALVAGRVPLLIEIKDQTGALGHDTGALEAAVARDLHGYGGPVAVMSYNPHTVAAMEALAPGVPRGLTTEAFDQWPRLDEGRALELRGIPDYDRVGASFISHDAGDLGRPRVAQLKAAGAAILCWTIRSPEAEAEARRIADNVTFEGYAPAIPPP